MTVKVTVLIAAYNCADFVGRAVESALAQTGVDLEILLVNDASTDETQAVLDAFAARDPRIRALRLATNGGPSAARNLGLDHATGDWVAVLDADDAFTAGRLEHLIAVGQRVEADIVADNFSFFAVASSAVSPSRNRTAPEQQTLDLAAFLDGARPYQADDDFGLLKPVFRRQFLEAHQLRYNPDVRHAEDFEFIVHALLAGARYVWNRASVGYLYTTRDSGRSRTQVNDHGMIVRTLGLLDLPAVRQDPRLTRGVRGRAQALQRLELDRLSVLPSEIRPRRRILQRALSSPVGWRWLAERATRKLVRTPTVNA